MHYIGISQAVLMHLLVLGAFWLSAKEIATIIQGLNALSGAGCFLASRQRLVADNERVLMHLLVLGAFWLQGLNTTQEGRDMS